MAAIRLNLQSIESQVVAGKVTPDSIGEFKSAVDDVRLRVWAIMSAQQEPDGGGALKRFRTRRAVEILDSVTADLTDPAMTGGGKELELLRGAVQRFLKQLDMIKS